ncbi:MAG: hypothetical protein AABX03_00935 [Nanoarchaeota archaeon]
MAKIEIIEDLYEKIEKKFGGDAIKVFALIKSLEENPKKGKTLGHVGSIVIKEIKYGSFRFYFITDGFKLRTLSKEDLIDLLIKFVRMSDKKDQQETINEIKKILTYLGTEGFK